MAVKQTANFAYNSELNIIDEVRQGAKELVTSDGIFRKMRQMGATSLIDSGYVADCIISIKKNHYLEYGDDGLKLGDELYDSTFFIPDGLTADGVAKFKHVTLPAKTFVTEVFEFKKSSVLDCDVSIIYDYDNKRIICAPNRTAVKIDGEPDGNYFQYIFAQNEEPIVVTVDTEDEGTIWWDTANNKIKEYTAGGWIDRNYSIPLGIGNRIKGNTAEIKVDFTVAGYLQKATWVNPGVQFNFPEGRSNDDDNALITNPKTSGRDELGHDTYQPVLKYVLADEQKISENHSFSFNPDSASKNSIKLIRLDGICRANNTLSLTVIKNGVSTKKDPRTYELANDDRTIMLTSPITILEGETITVVAEYYDTYENAPLYITNSWEIIGPEEQLTFSDDAGHYFDDKGKKVIACKYATLTFGYVVPKNIRQSEPISIVVFTPKTCFTLADGDDIEAILELIGTSTGDTMNQVLSSIEELNGDLSDMDEEHKALLDALKAEIYDKMAKELVHIESPTPTSVETITGNKKFTGTVEANIDGVTSHVHKVFSKVIDGIDDDVEIKPMGIPVQYKSVDGNMVEDTDYNYTDEDEIRVNTTVRVGSNYVKATEFRGTAMKALWADLAEVFVSDKNYPAGTLIKFGGDAEITEALDGEANGVIAEAPAFLMNAGIKGLPVAMVGRVKVLVDGIVHKGDKLVCPIGRGVAKVKGDHAQPTLAIALEDNEDPDTKLVMCVVKLSLD